MAQNLGNLILMISNVVLVAAHSNIVTEPTLPLFEGLIQHNVGIWISSTHKYIFDTFCAFRAFWYLDKSEFWNLTVQCPIKSSVTLNPDISFPPISFIVVLKLIEKTHVVGCNDYIASVNCIQLRTSHMISWIQRVQHQRFSKGQWGFAQWRTLRQRPNTKSWQMVGWTGKLKIYY